MEHQIRCKKCNRMLGVKSGELKITDGETIGEQATDKQCKISIKCPRCNDIRNVIIKYE